MRSLTKRSSLKDQKCQFSNECLVMNTDNFKTIFSLLKPMTSSLYVEEFLYWDKLQNDRLFSTNVHHDVHVKVSEGERFTPAKTIKLPVYIRDYMYLFFLCIYKRDLLSALFTVLVFFEIQCSKTRT